jgi:hypothetical protein
MNEVLILFSSHDAKNAKVCINGANNISNNICEYNISSL